MLQASYDYKLTLLAVVVVTAVTVVVFVRAKVSPVMPRSRAARGVDLSFETVAQTVPAILWTARADGSVDFMGEQLYAYSGFTQAQGADWGWKEALHPDDLARCMERWQHCIRTGDAYEIEYRLRRSDGAYRWFLARANVVRDDQRRIIKWIGTCSDIEDQKHHQTILEEQIKERTEELADANNRLQQEMWERDLARRTLDQQNEKIMQDLTERSQRATLLAKMGELLQSCLSKDEVFDAALGFAPKIFPTSRGAIALLNSARDLVEVAGKWHDCQISVPTFEPASCWALRTGHPHLVVAGDSTARCAHAAGSEKYLSLHPYSRARQSARHPALSGDRRGSCPG